MKDLHVKIADETNQQVQAVLGERSLDEFTDEALRREALRHEAGRKLNESIEEGRASGLTGGTLDQLIEEAELARQAAPIRDGFAAFEAMKQKLQDAAKA